MLVKEAKEFGNISKRNTKMPGTSYAIDAFACKTGSKLAKIEGTPCHKCYARKLQKLRPSVDQGYKANLSKWKMSDKTQWIAAMVLQIDRYCKDKFHRWFDSGDLQSLEMLENIVDVCLMTPSVNHWLPTQERGIVKQYLDTHGSFPSNLVVRVSASKIDPIEAPSFPHSSTVFKHATPIGKECKARHNGNQCGSCRACWSSDVPVVSYPQH